MSFFGVGAGEALVVLVLAMIVVGPQRFPEIARQGGRWYRLARQYTDEVMKDVRSAVDEIEQEIKEETGDVTSISSISSDLRAIRDDIDAVGTESASEAAQAVSDSTEAVTEAADAASTNGTESTATRNPSVRPSRRAEDR